jgi:hypothetical protein
MVRYGPIAARSLLRQRDEAMFEIDRKIVRGGKTGYRAAVGILILDTKFLSMLGDFGYALNWPFPVP